MAAGIPEGFGRLFKLESVAMGRPDRANARVRPMSALGHKQTFFDCRANVRFRGQSGPNSLSLEMSAISHKRT